MGKTGKKLPLQPMKRFLSFDLSFFKKYLSEKNALTVVTCIFCLIMMIVAIAKANLWLSLAFALAFSFGVEVICHRVQKK